MKKQRVNYRFYASLLDKFQSYLSSSEIYQQFWGFSENPEKTEEQFEAEQFQGLIDYINRVPFESELADKGTAFNEVVDCIIEGRKSDKMQIEKILNPDGIAVGIKADYKQWSFTFNTDLCREFAIYFKGALTQQQVTGTLPTQYGDVEVYGYLDILMPFKVADIKTTGKYFAGKFRNNWQHIVYPFCLNSNGVEINEFEYAVTNFKNSWIEVYNFRKEIDTPKLIAHCELFVEFLISNKHLITDKKIFNE